MILNHSSRSMLHGLGGTRVLPYMVIGAGQDGREDIIIGKFAALPTQETEKKDKFMKQIELIVN